MLGQQLNDGDEFLDILAAALLALEISAKLLSLSNSAHELRSERAHLLCPGADSVITLDVRTAKHFPQGFARRGIGDANGNGKPR